MSGNSNSSNNMHNLTTLIKRLEAATSRLEDIATSTELPDGAPLPSQSITSEHEGSSALEPKPRASVPRQTGKPDKDTTPDTVQQFDHLIDSTVTAYVRSSNKLGGVVAKQAGEVLRGFQEQRTFLLIATQAAKPDAAAFQSLLKPINDCLISVTELKDSNRPDPMYTHLNAVADGLMMLAWITTDGRPYKHVEESFSSAQFFGNRVLKEHKDKDPKQVEWVQSFYTIFRRLAEYTKQNFPSGITWNAEGEPAREVAKKLSQRALASTSSGPPPPPPPPGPAPIVDIKMEKATSATPGGFGAVFSDLNKGSDVTRGLRKVDKSEMTHKNPSLRTSSSAGDEDGSPRGKSPAPGKKPKPESMRLKKPPKKVLDGNKWTIENYDKETEPIEIETTLTQSVLISRCSNTAIILKGKANQVTIENSMRLSLVVDSLVSTVDVVKAQKFALQVIGALPTIMLDQVDDGQIYFSKESIGTKVFTSKSSGINLNILSGPDDDYKELPLPSQICSYFDESKNELVNEIVAHAG